MKKEISRKDNLSLNAEIIFSKVNPENIIYKTRTLTSVIGETLDSDLYCKISQNMLPDYTEDENRTRYHELSCMLEKDGADVFSVLWNLGNQTLVEKNEELFCKMPYLLYWNSITSKIGQDTVISAWMAHQDSEVGVNRSHRYGFDWKPVLMTDDALLNGILNKGLAENHYHLNGSTQSFMLNWAFLMNYPKMADSMYEEKSFSNGFLSPRIIYSPEERLESPMELIRFAAHIRFALFMWSGANNNYGDAVQIFHEYQNVGSIHKLNNKIDAYRNEFGVRWAKRNGTRVCLDYAASRNVYNVPENSPLRLLTGERALLYNCFYRIFTDRTPNEIKGLLYAYLLIKNILWREIVMTNRQIGFAMFEHYQDRKDSGFYQDEAYSKEALILSAVSSIVKGNVKSLEARIMPKADYEKLGRTITEANNTIEKWVKKAGVRSSFFYTLHFGKGKEELKNIIEVENRGSGAKDDSCILSRLGGMRNMETRTKAMSSALAIDKALTESQVCKLYIKGLDACSSELYCRPEVFATEYRFLRNRLGVTYHVGEDFLDIGETYRIDGWRPDRNGYGFLGWSTVKNATEPEYLSNQELEGGLEDDITLYAVWRAYFTVTYDGNGGYLLVYDDEKDEDVEVLSYVENTDLSSEGNWWIRWSVADREGYRFLGWSLNKDDDGSEAQNVFNYEIDDDVTVYAIWEKLAKITFDYGTWDDNDDGVADEHKSYDYMEIGRELYLGDYYDSILDNRPGYRFDGWLVNSDALNRIRVTGDITVTVDWVEDAVIRLNFTGGNVHESWHINKDISGASQYVYDDSVEFGVNIGETVYLVHQDLPWKSGYVFNGWVDKNGQPVNKIVAAAGVNEVYASWIQAEETYTVTFDANGGTFSNGTGTMTKQAAYRINVRAFAGEDPVRPGYIFTGWRESGVNDGTEEGYILGEITYVAMWDEAVSVTFNLNGGDLYKVNYVDYEEQLVSGISAVYSLFEYNVYFGMGIVNYYSDDYYYTAMKEGYGVRAWNTKSDGSGIWYDNGDSVLADDSFNGVTLYAFYAHEVCNECYGLGGNHDSSCPYYEDYA